MRLAAALAAVALLVGCAQPAPDAGPAVATTVQAPAGAAEGYGWFGDLVGSCWKGQRPDGAEVDTHCFMLQYDSIVRSGVKMGPVDVEAIFARDPAGGRVRYTQWASTGFYGTGEYTIEGDKLVFVNRLADGSLSANIRSIWRRTGPEGFQVARELKDESGTWKEVSTVDYRRVR